MPTIIKPALFAKVAASQQLRQLLDDFALITGVEAQLVDPTGHHFASTPRCPRAAMCERLQASQPGRRYCDATVRDLFRQASRQPTVLHCDAGLAEAAVAVHISGLDVAFLRFAGLRSSHRPAAEVAHVQHLLHRAGVELDREEITRLLTAVPGYSPATLEAYLRLLARGVHHIVQDIDAHADESARSMPKLARRAVAVLRRRALVENLDLTSVAGECGVSPSHLSRLFHRATGLTFREYLGRYRANHAHDLLLNSRRSITDIAFASGFQSFSQFNRTMQRVYGRSPREIRRNAHHGVTDDPRGRTDL